MLFSKLSFSGEAEDAFKQGRVRSSQDLHLCCRAAGLLKWALVAHSVGLGSPATPLALLCVACALAATAVALHAPRMSIRLVYPLELAADIVQPLCACSLFHHIYPAGAAAGAGAMRAVACVLAGNGVLALACLTKTSPLTFRWQLPVLATVGGALLAHAPSFGASPLVQHGYATLGTLGRILLPLVAPAFVDLSPKHGFAALLAPVPDAGARGAGEAAAAAAAAAACQAAAVALGCCALGASLYRAELRQRKAFALAQAARQGSAPRAAPASRPQPAVPEPTSGPSAT